MSGPALSTDEVNRIVKYCGEETRRQYAYYFGPEPEHIALKTAGMIHAWMDALEHQFHGDKISVGMIERWGSFVEPEINAKGFRRYPVSVGPHLKLNHLLINRALEQLCESIDDIDALVAYREFEEIHPFGDGNGRTGKIILNYQNGTMLDPIFPPRDFWGMEIENP